MEIMGIGSVAAIVVICYLLAEACKATQLDRKWLPVVCGALGGVLGAVAWCVMDAYPANDVLTAIAYGIVSGLSATGVNQIWKQLSGDKE